MLVVEQANAFLELRTCPATCGVPQGQMHAKEGRVACHHIGASSGSLSKVVLVGVVSPGTGQSKARATACR